MYYQIKHHFLQFNFRTIPGYEISAAAESLNNIFNCNIPALPTEMLIHHFVGMWLSRHKRLTPFYKCTSWVQKKYSINMNQCKKDIKPLCPQRFGNSYERQDICRKLLWDVRHNNRSRWYDILSSRFPNVSRILDKTSDKVIKDFIRYHSCMENLTNHLSICFPKLEAVCKNSTVRAIKTVRITMETVEAILKNNSDIQTLHLLRDPRAVAISRLKQPSFRGRKSGRNIAKEAAAYCQTAARDSRKAKSLAELHHGKILSIVYEDFVNNPVNKLEEIYKFLHMSQPASTTKWLNEYTAVKNENSTIRAYLWMKNLTLDEALNINQVCTNLTKEISHTWPLFR